MAETFYSALGVDADAERETIESAYRDLVKETHPDVSDDPDAPERFKRLTTARDVLVDEDERARYDRLGHDAYVTSHVDSSLWSSPGRSPTEPPSPSRPTQKSQRTHRRRRGTDGGTTSGYDRTAWLGENGPSRNERTAKSEYRKRRQQRRRARAAGVGVGEDWQQASETYQRADVDIGEPESSPWSWVTSLGQVGPWLVVHVIFIASALATAWLTFLQAGTALELSVPMVVFGILVIGMVVVVSVLHVISQLYA